MDTGIVMVGDDFLKALIVRFVFNEIDVFGINQKGRDLLVFAEVGEVFLLDVGKVLGGDVALKIAAAAGDLPEQTVGGGVEVEDQVGLGQRTSDGVEHGPEQRELVGGKVVLREEQALVDEVVADDEVAEEVARREQRLELLVTIHEEGHLHGKGIVLGILVELLEEGIVGETLQHELRVEVAGEHRGQGRLARPNASLHDNVIIGDFHFLVEGLLRFKV